MRAGTAATLTIGALLVAGAGLVAWDRQPYTVSLLMPAADSTIVGGAVTVQGQKAGKVEHIGVRDGHAVITVALDDAFAPLHTGTVARINWQSVLGARTVDLLPGSTSNPEVHSGTLLTDAVERVELDDVLAALDGPTREKLQKLVAQLDSTFDGHEQDLNETLRTAGPAVDALGALLSAVGEDGPTIRRLVAQLADVSTTLADRDHKVASTVGQLDDLTATVARQQKDISATIHALPGALKEANATLGDVEGPIGNARQLLRDVRPATSELPGTSKRLAPVLQELVPVAENLGPVLNNLGDTFEVAPTALDTVDATVPDVGKAIDEAGPMVSFLRPYTPELIGWLSNWTSVFMGQNASGNFGRALMTVSMSAFNSNPLTTLPGIQQKATTEPGAIVGQPWTDANGDGIR
jgi:phospholipid/cholesterol/gamma-HCH transport system substrate-binding protein